MSKRNGGGDKPRKPIQVIRISTLSASIWENDGDNGKWHSVTLQRSYKGKGGEWEYSESLNRNDLLVAAELLRQAFVAIIERQRELRESDKDEEDEEEEKEKERPPKRSKKSDDDEPIPY